MRLATGLSLKGIGKAPVSRQARLQRPVGQAGLRLPVARRKGAGVAVLHLADNVELEDVVRQAEKLGVQVEVAVLWWVVVRLALGPLDDMRRRSEHAFFGGALKPSRRRSRPEVAALWLGGIAEISRLATIGKVWLDPECRETWSGLWTKSDLERGRSNGCVGHRRVSQLQGSGRRRFMLDSLVL